MSITQLLASVATTLNAVGPDDSRYEGGDYVMQREYGMTPMGNPLCGQWVLRTVDGEWLDFDAYRSDLAERYNLKVQR